MSLLIWFFIFLGIVIAIALILAIIGAYIDNGDDDDDSFMAKTRKSIQNGCAKLLKIVRGC